MAISTGSAPPNTEEQGQADAEAPDGLRKLRRAPGFSRQKIDFSLIIDPAGNVIDVRPMREQRGKKTVAKLLSVPNPQRTSNVMPNFLWDKTAYIFGVTATESIRTAREHEAFRKAHLSSLADASDPDLISFREFIQKWCPERFALPPFTPEMLDTNFVVEVDGTRRFIHEADEARQILAQEQSGSNDVRFCLVSGGEAPITRLHPVIKNVRGAQSSGAPLVSFNAPAFESFLQKEGAGAPTSEDAAFRYGNALNRLLASDSNKLQLGDATTVFWADTSISGEAAAAASEALLGAIFGSVERRDTDYDAVEAAKIRDRLETLAAGRPTQIDDVDLKPDTRIHILGLSPNAARLSVRFWLADTLGHLAQNLAAHAEDCRIEPLPWRTPPTINRLLVKTVAMQEKFENIPPLLAGEVARAILTGGRYPRMLLSTAIIRIRAGDDPGEGWHAAVIRAVLQRLPKEGAPMSLDKEEPSPAYRLGRLFAVLEAAQYNALGRVNATIRDRYFGAASATPASVFPLLLRGGQNHLANLRKEGKAGGLEREIEDIMAGLATELPRSLRLEDQGRFAIGYYHQRAARFAKKDGANTEANQGDSE